MGDTEILYNFAPDKSSFTIQKWGQHLKFCKKTMIHFEITVSVRDARKANDVINYDRYLNNNLEQSSTNVWEDLRKDVEDEETADEKTLMLLDNLMEVFYALGIEFEKRVYNED